MGGVGAQLRRQRRKQRVAVAGGLALERDGADFQPVGVGADFAAEGVGQELVAVADAEHRQTGGHRLLEPAAHGFAETFALADHAGRAGEHRASDLTVVGQRFAIDGADNLQRQAAVGKQGGDVLFVVAETGADAGGRGAEFDDNQGFGSGLRVHHYCWSDW